MVVFATRSPSSCGELKHVDRNILSRDVDGRWMTDGRTPDASDIKSKMIYTSSKDSLRRKLDGISKGVQATDASEIDYSVVLEKMIQGTQ